MTQQTLQAIINNDRMITEAAANYLGIKAATLRKWRCTKKENISYIKIGSKVFYKKSDLDEYIERCKVTS